MRFSTLLLFISLGNVYAYGGELSLGAGKLLNNSDTAHPGYLVEASYDAGPVGLTFAKITNSMIGDEMLGTLTYRHEWHYVSLGGGVILADSYEVPSWWFTSRDPQYWGKSGYCVLCGLTVEARLRLTERLDLKLAYVGNEHFILPSRNGALVSLQWRLQ
jgi:hypothetical protein